ncbi:hypothetical protein RRG08_006846 [Elysia crispata]|uniref:Uncharacterized protein n=1 Tax=Elysia crispata TaxID=231223 RepID=A0AAE1CN92_9GAST|nr:hypothetical protein RRG08_006846 [Elysia crispata]
MSSSRKRFLRNEKCLRADLAERLCLTGPPRPRGNPSVLRSSQATGRPGDQAARRSISKLNQSISSKTAPRSHQEPISRGSELNILLLRRFGGQRDGVRMSF